MGNMLGDIERTTHSDTKITKIKQEEIEEEE